MLRQLKSVMLNLGSAVYKRKLTQINNFGYKEQKQRQQQKITFMQKQQQQTKVQVESQGQEDFNALNNYNDDLFDDILTNKKRYVPQEQKVMKRRQKINKMLKQHEKDPQVNKQRNRQRHQKQRQKLQTQLQGMTEQQKRAHLDKRKQQRLDFKNKARDYLEQEKGIPFIIDVAYQNRMDDKENKSLAIQIDLIIKAIKKMQQPANIYVAGNKGRVKTQLQRMQYQHWPLKVYQEDLKQCLTKQPRFNNKKKNIYYLSPDSPDVLETINTDEDVFIIGGLVDRTVIKNASVYRAYELGIKAVSLPIRQYMKQRYCLNLDHIVSIMCKFAECKDWKEAFYYGAPKRWKKDQNQLKQSLKIKQAKQKRQQERSSKSNSSGSQSDFDEDKPAEKSE